MTLIVVPNLEARYDPTANTARAVRKMRRMLADADRARTVPDTGTETSGQRRWSLSLAGGRGFSVTWSQLSDFEERRLRIVCFDDDMIIETFVTGVYGGDDPKLLPPLLGRVIDGLALVGGLATDANGDVSAFEIPAAAIMLDAHDRIPREHDGKVEIAAATPWSAPVLGMSFDQLSYVEVDDATATADLALLPQVVTLTVACGRKHGRESITIHAGPGSTEIDPSSYTAVARLRLAADLIALRAGDRR
jgi:hypothetical protein